MKLQISYLAFALVIFAAVAITSFAQGKKEGKGNAKEQHGNNGNNGKGNSKHNNGNDNKPGNSGKDHGKGDEHKNNGNGNNGKGNDKDHGNGNDKHDDGDQPGNGKNKMKDGYRWDNETFADRNKIRNNMNKVTICHKFKNGNEPGVTIRVAEPALKAHLNHGDVMGDCPAVTGNYSDVFIKRRADYYNVLESGQEQVLYSRSILDYAIERLTGARSQLVTLQNTNAPAADIEQKRVLVVDLEQNVSLLQTLLGVTANLLANKWAN